MLLPRQGLRRFFGGDADCFAGADIDERGRNFSPVAELESALAEATACNYGNRIGGAAVDLDKSHKALAIFSAGIFDAEFGKTEHRQAHSEHLPGAEMAMGLFGVAQIFVEGIHCRLSAFGCRLSSFGFQLNTCMGKDGFKMAGASMP